MNSPLNVSNTRNSYLLIYILEKSRGVYLLFLVGLVHKNLNELRKILVVVQSTFFPVEIIERYNLYENIGMHF